MYKLRKKSKGFTVIELMLALALGAMFTAIFFQFFFVHQKALNSTAIRSQLQMDMQQSMEYFSKSAMEASRISNINGITGTSDINLGNLADQQLLGETGITFSVDNADDKQLNTYKLRVVGKNLNYTEGTLPEKTLCRDRKSVV